MSGEADDPQPDHSATQAELVARWTREVVRTSYVPMARRDVEAFLAECLEDLVASLRAEQFSTTAAGEVGARLIRIHFTGSAALERTMTLLATELPALLPNVDRARLIALISGLAAGYAGQLRDQTLDEQELIKQAVLQARDAAEEALRASEARLRAVFGSSALGIAVVSLGGTVEEVNAAMRQIFRAAETELVGGTVFDLVDEAWLWDLRLSEAELVSGDVERFQAETRFSCADGSHIWTQLSASLVRDAEGEPEYQVVLYEDITERHMLQEQLHRQATHDPLTGLANRTLLQTRMDTALDAAHPGRRVGLAYFDLDGFKAINDSLGHPAGDALLRAVAQRLQALTVAEGALTARMGGDEFVVLVPDSLGAADMVDLVQRLLDEITRPVRVHGQELNVSASVGIVDAEVASTGPDELLRDADITLYRAKNEGKAQWVLSEPESNAAARGRFKLSAILPSALDEDEFFVEYRPVYWLDGSGPVAVEADVRWDHPEHGELGERDFLGLAEETGIIIKLGNWVLRQVCTHAARWTERLGSLAPFAACRLSPRHFRDPDLVSDVQHILAETGMPPDKLALVVGDDALFDHDNDPLDTVEILREMGLRLVVEDFGGHYTSLSRLRKLSVAAVKIAGPYVRSFADPDGPAPVDEHIVSSLISGARLLGMSVLIDGVDTAEQADRLRGIGAQLAMGEHAGGLASALEIEELVADGQAVS